MAINEIQSYEIPYYLARSVPTQVFSGISAFKNKVFDYPLSTLSSYDNLVSGTFGASPVGYGLRSRIAFPMLANQSILEATRSPGYIFDPTRARKSRDELGRKIGAIPGTAWAKTIETGFFLKTLPAVNRALAGQAVKSFTPLGLGSILHGFKGGSLIGRTIGRSRFTRNIAGGVIGGTLLGSPLGGLLTAGPISRILGNKAGPLLGGVTRKALSLAGFAYKAANFLSFGKLAKAPSAAGLTRGRAVLGASAPGGGLLGMLGIDRRGVHGILGGLFGTPSAISPADLISTRNIRGGALYSTIHGAGDISQFDANQLRDFSRTHGEAYAQLGRKARKASVKHSRSKRLAEDLTRIRGQTFTDVLGKPGIFGYGGFWKTTGRMFGKSLTTAVDIASTGFFGMPISTAGDIFSLATGRFEQKAERAIAAAEIKIDTRLSKINRISGKLSTRTKYYDTESFRLKSTARLSKTRARAIAKDALPTSVGLAARKSMMALNRLMVLSWVAGGIKNVGKDIIKGGIESVKEAMEVSKGIGSMEFGTGKTLQTRLGNTERSRAISAMQNVGISARSYLGQEAKIMSQD